MQEFPKVHSYLLITCDFFGPPLVFTATFREFAAAADEWLLGVAFYAWLEAFAGTPPILFNLSQFIPLILIAVVHAGRFKFSVVLIGETQDPQGLGIGIADSNTGWVVEVLVRIFYELSWHGSFNDAHRQVLIFTHLDGILLVTKIEIFFVLICHLL